MAARRSSPGGDDAGRLNARSARSKDHREFVSEGEEILERLFEDLAELHEQRQGAAEVDPDLVNRIFRSAHSLKGLAGLFDLEAISEIAHHFEDILDALRLGRIPIDSPAIDLLDEGVSLMAALMKRLERGDAIGDAEQEMARAFIAEIAALVQAPVAVTRDPLESLDLDPTLLRSLTEYEEHRLRVNLDQGRRIARVDASYAISDFEEGLSELTEAMREVAEVVSTLPSPGAVPESEIRFSLLVASDIEAEQLWARLEDRGVEVREVAAGPESNRIAHEASAPSLDLPEEAEPVAAPPAGRPASESREMRSLRSISETVRVDIRKLDELMNLVGELVIQRNAVGELVQRLTNDLQTARIGRDLAKTHKALERQIKALQAGVLDVRMVPLQQIFEKLARAVRRLRRDLGKDVELEFKGADTELDKLIVEQLVDPLVHLVRNAFDHALESPERRAAAGKPETGHIRVSALQRGNHVVIEVCDDGRGMDVAAIRARAIAQGLIGELDSLSDREILNLVFEAGLSTSDQVSETSGRGVGMDVVRSNLAEMGGMVDLRSEPGVGTTVTITLPITLAILQALIVGVGEERFAIPLNSVLETLSIEPDQIGHSEGREILSLRGEPLLLRRLGEEFEIPCSPRSERQFVVVLGMGEQRIGLLVDLLDRQQDAVIKPIKGPVQQIRGIAGATELGDRGAILVIDVAAIVADALRRREAA